MSYHLEKGVLKRMESGNDHERVKDNKHDDGSLNLSGLCVRPLMSSA